MKNRPLQIGNTAIQPGERVTLGLPTPELSTYISMHIPIHVIHGKREGPCLLISGALHGDEMNGIQIIHRLLTTSQLKNLCGTLIAVPAINVYGLMTLTRTLPDRRDLDGSFPGTSSGSFASRLAHTFTEEILSLATHCIDIHTAAPYQNALPRICTDLDWEQTHALARAFQAPVLMHDLSSRGLLWKNKERIPTLIFEAGEPLRLDERTVRTGFRGILRIMRYLNMLKLSTQTQFNSIEIRKSEWLYAPGSGLCYILKKNGSVVQRGESVGSIYDPFGTMQKFSITAPCTGVIITQNTLPLVNEGDPILQIASTEEEISPALLDNG